MKRFRTVELVADERMPVGTDWLVVRTTGGSRHLFVRRSRCVGDCGSCPIAPQVFGGVAAVVVQSSSSTAPMPASA